MELNFSNRWDLPAPGAPLKARALLRTEPNKYKGAFSVLVSIGQAASHKQEVQLSF